MFESTSRFIRHYSQLFLESSLMWVVKEQISRDLEESVSIPSGMRARLAKWSLVKIMLPSIDHLV